MPNSYAHLHYQVIFGTREQRPILGSDWRDELRRYVGGVVLRQGGLLHGILVQPDHIHLLARFRAEPSLAAMMRLVKANSSKWINQRRFVAEGFAWAPGYDAYTVSYSELEAIRIALRQRGSQPRGPSFERQRRALMDGDAPADMPDTHTRLLYHLVFGTKYRQPTIDGAWQNRLYAHLTALVEAHRGVVVEINGMPDHVHLLARFKADPSMAVMLHHIKGGSSNWVKKQEFLHERFEWQVGYAAFSVGPSQEERVRRYVQEQQKHHRRYSFDEEMKAFRRRHTPKNHQNPTQRWPEPTPGAPPGAT